MAEPPAHQPPSPAESAPGLSLEPMTAADEATIAAQLGRQPRGVAGIAWRCPCGRPGVVATEPRLPPAPRQTSGTPFPTTYYLTCPRATSATSTLEASGLMAQMTERLGQDAALAADYRRAHESYLADRARLGEVPEIEGTSAGGMPSRVKCLHVLVGHALARGPGTNPLGDEAVAALGEFWARPCLENDAPSAGVSGDDPGPKQPGRDDPGPEMPGRDDLGPKLPGRDDPGPKQPCPQDRPRNVEETP